MSGPRSIVLVGMMASGKTTAGEAVAGRLGWDFIDSDRQVEAATGHTVEEIWAAEGEQAFRRLEARALADALASTARRPAVVAAAGGVVLDPANRALLRRHPPVVWLRADPATLADRAGSGPGRPLLAGGPRETLARLWAERRPLYQEVADAVVDVDGLGPDEVVEQVLAAAGARPSPTEQP